MSLKPNFPNKIVGDEVTCDKTYSSTSNVSAYLLSQVIQTLSHQNINTHISPNEANQAELKDVTETDLTYFKIMIAKITLLIF